MQGAAPQSTKAPAAITSLKPNVKSLKYSTPNSFSQSQNPISMGQHKKLKSGEYDFKSTVTSNNNNNNSNNVNNNDKS